MALGDRVPDHTSIFPPLPTEQDELDLIETIENAQVPNSDDNAMLEPIIELTDLKKSQSHYYTSVPFQGIPGFDPKLLEFDNCNLNVHSDTIVNEIQSALPKNDQNEMEIDNELPKEPVHQNSIEAVDMEKELFLAFENLSTDTTKKSPVSNEDLLTLLSFNSSHSVGVCNITTTPYDSKSLINELLLLRLPGLFTFFGGEKVAGMDVQILEEIQSLQKTRKKEKERDSGQGKAPVKMSEARKKKLKAKADERRLGMSDQKAKKEALAALSSLGPGSNVV